MDLEELELLVGKRIAAAIEPRVMQAAEAGHLASDGLVDGMSVSALCSKMVEFFIAVITLRTTGVTEAMLVGWLQGSQSTTATATADPVFVDGLVESFMEDDGGILQLVHSQACPGVPSSLLEFPEETQEKLWRLYHLIIRETILALLMSDDIEHHLRSHGLYGIE